MTSYSRNKPWNREQQDKPWYCGQGRNLEILDKKNQTLKSWTRDNPWNRFKPDKPWHRGQGRPQPSLKDSWPHGIYNLVVLLQLVDDDGTVETALMNYLFAKQVVSRLRNQMNVADLQRKRSYWKQCAFNAVSCFGKWTWCALLPSRTLYKLLLTSRACVSLAVQPLTPVIAVEHLQLSRVFPTGYGWQNFLSPWGGNPTYYTHHLLKLPLNFLFHWLDLKFNSYR